MSRHERDSRHGNRSDKRVMNSSRNEEHHGIGCSRDTSGGRSTYHRSRSPPASRSSTLLLTNGLLSRSSKDSRRSDTQRRSSPSTRNRRSSTNSQRNARGLSPLLITDGELSPRDRNTTGSSTRPLSPLLIRDGRLSPGNRERSGVAMTTNDTFNSALTGSGSELSLSDERFVRERLNELNRQGGLPEFDSRYNSGRSLDLDSIHNPAQLQSLDPRFSMESSQLLDSLLSLLGHPSINPLLQQNLLHVRDNLLSGDSRGGLDRERIRESLIRAQNSSSYSTGRSRDRSSEREMRRYNSSDRNSEGRRNSLSLGRENDRYRYNRSREYDRFKSRSGERLERRSRERLDRRSREHLGRRSRERLDRRSREGLDRRSRERVNRRSRERLNRRGKSPDRIGRSRENLSKRSKSREGRDRVRSREHHTRSKSREHRDRLRSREHLNGSKSRDRTSRSRENLSRRSTSKERTSRNKEHKNESNEHKDQTNKDKDTVKTQDENNIELKGSGETETRENVEDKIKDDSEIDVKKLREDNEVDRNIGNSSEMAGDTGKNEVDGKTGNSEVAGNTETSETDGNTESSEMAGGTGSSEMDGNTGSREMDGNTGSSEITGDTGSSEMDGNTGSSEVDGNTGSSEMAGDTGSSEMNRNTGSCEITGDTVSSEMDGNTGSSEVDGNTGSSEMDGNTGSSEMDGNTGSSEMAGDTGSSEMNRNTGSCDTDGNTGNSSEIDDKTGNSEVVGNLLTGRRAMVGSTIKGIGDRVKNTGMSEVDANTLVEETGSEKNTVLEGREKDENPESSEGSGDTLAESNKMDGITVVGNIDMDSNVLLGSSGIENTENNGNTESNEIDGYTGNSELDGDTRTKVEMYTGTGEMDGDTGVTELDVDTGNCEMDGDTGNSGMDEDIANSEIDGGIGVIKLDVDTGNSAMDGDTLIGSDKIDGETRNSEMDRENRNIYENAESIEIEGNGLIEISEMDSNTRSIEMDGNKENTEINGNTESIKMDENAGTFEVDTLIGNSELDRNTGSGEMDGNTGSGEMDGNTGNSKMDGNTGSCEMDGNTGSCEMNENTGSGEMDGNTGNSEVDGNTGSSEVDGNTGSCEMDQKTGSNRVDQNIVTGNKVSEMEDLPKDDLQVEHSTVKIDMEKPMTEYILDTNNLDTDDLLTEDSAIDTGNLLLTSTMDTGGMQTSELNTNLQCPDAADLSDTEMDISTLNQSDVTMDTTITDEDDAELDMEEEEVSHFMRSEAENQCRGIKKEIRVPVRHEAKILIQLPKNPLPVYSRVTVYKQNGPTLLTSENGRVITTDCYKGRVKYTSCSPSGVVKIQINQVKLEDEGTYMVSFDDVVVEGPVLNPFIPTDIAMGIDKTAVIMLSFDKSCDYQSFDVVKEDNNLVQNPLFSVTSQNHLNLQDNYCERLQFQGDMASGRCWFELHKITLGDSGKYILKHGSEILSSQRLTVHGYQTYCQKRGVQKAKKNYRNPEVIAGEIKSLREYLSSRPLSNMECSKLLDNAIMNLKLNLKLNYMAEVAGKVGYRTIFSGKLQIKPNIFLIRENGLNKKELSKSVYEKAVQLLITKTPEEILKQVDPGPYQCPESDELKLEMQKVPNYDEQARKDIMDAATNEAIPKQRFDEMIRYEMNRESVSEESLIAAIKARVLTQGSVNYDELMPKVDVQSNDKDLNQQGINPDTSIQDMNKFVVIERPHVVDDRKSFALQILTNSANMCGLKLKWLVTSPVYSVPKTPLFVYRCDMWLVDTLIGEGFALQKQQAIRLAAANALTYIYKERPVIQISSNKVQSRNCVSYEELILKSEEMKESEGDNEDYGITDSGVDKWFIRAVEDVLINYKNHSIIDPLRIMSGFDKKEEEQIKSMCRNLQLDPKLRREGKLRMLDIEKHVKPEDILKYLTDEDNKSDKYTLMSEQDRYTIAEVIEQEVKDKISI